MHHRVVTAVLGLGLWAQFFPNFSAATANLRDFVPVDDAAVIEILAPRAARLPTAAAAPDLRVIEPAARELIEQSRREADPRYLGRAEALLAPWWSKPDAPPAAAILQATIEQSRHQFEPARTTLTNLLKRHPAQPQGWLTLASLERLAGRYGAAEAACEAVARHGAALYARACSLENDGLLGRHQQASTGLTGLLAQTRDPGVRAWVLSLLAENEERAGRDDLAQKAFRASLALAPDSYTSIALADHLLRKGKWNEALAALKGQTASDAVLIRQAYALKRLGDPRWLAVKGELAERFAALRTRGEDSVLHARELALLAIWLEGDATKALPIAQSNLAIQKEPLDWWLALSAALESGAVADARKIRSDLIASGLKDRRLDRLTESGAK